MLLIYNDFYSLQWFFFLSLNILTGTSKPVRWHKGGELNVISLIPSLASLWCKKDSLVCHVALLLVHYVSLCRKAKICVTSSSSTLNLSKLLPRQLRFESHSKLWHIQLAMSLFSSTNQSEKKRSLPKTVTPSREDANGSSVFSFFWVLINWHGQKKRKTMCALLSLPSKEGSQVPFSNGRPILFTLRDRVVRSEWVDRRERMINSSHGTIKRASLFPRQAPPLTVSSLGFFSQPLEGWFTTVGGESCDSCEKLFCSCLNADKLL